MTTDPIELVLSSDEALVLFEWLSNLDSSGNGPSDNSAERKVLWSVEGQLEKRL